MAERVLGPRGGRRRKRLLLLPLLAAAVLALFFITSAQATDPTTTGQFELDKNATDNLTSQAIGHLDGNMSATDTSIVVCQFFAQTAPPSFTIQIEAEQMTVTAVTGSGSGIGGCPSGTVSKRTYTVDRSPGGTADNTAHAASGFTGDVTKIVTGSVNGTDWDQVYQQVTLDSDDTGNDDKCVALGAVECAWVHDPEGKSVYTTGGSKDDLDIPNWRYTDSSVPDADEILDAYAIKYSNGHQFLYFGADRLAVNGSKDFGFWFFHSPVGLNTDGTFSGQHTTPSGGQRGDLLILGTFTQGGAATNIRVFEWVGSGGDTNGVLDLVGAFGDCSAGGGASGGCGTVSNTSVPAPWPYQAKSASTAGYLPDGGLLEGGIDLTALGLEGCFSSFLAETRSSPEVGAQLKDFVLGNFEACGSSLTTTPKNGAGGDLTADSNSNNLVEASIGTGTVSVKDSAVLNVTGTSSFTGTLAFFICGPIATGTCSTGGVSAGSSTVTANGTYSSNAVTLTSVGRYCWRSTFTSGTTGVPNASDSTAESASGTGECFEVLPVTPTLDTQAVASTVNFGQAVQDNATLTGTATQPGTNGGDATYPTINATNGAPAGGKITFTLLGPNDCTTVTSGGTGTNPQDITTISGDGTYGPVSYTPASPGTYHWKAQYFPASGDVNNVGSTHNAGCTDTDEDVVVQKVPTSITTAQKVYPNDSATVSVSGSGTGNVQGSVKFRLFDTLANCQAANPSDTVGTGGLLYRQVVNLPGDATSSTVGTTNTTVAVTTNTTVYWLVEFTSTNPAQFGRNSVCQESTQTTFVNDSSGGTAP